MAKINPSYVGLTEAAAQKYGIPAELLARLLHKESNYQNVNNGGAKGIPQMSDGALKAVGVDPAAFPKAGAAAQIDAGAAYLALQYREFRDWPKAVAAYHSGFRRMNDWLAGRGPNFEDIRDRMKTEHRTEASARAQSNQWLEMQQYLPYIFLGDPHRYDSLESH